MQDDAINLSLRLPGFRVIGVAEWGDMIEIVVETHFEVACCPHCGHADVTVKERRTVSVQDLPFRPGVPTWLSWRKRRFTCRRCRKTFTEANDAVPTGGFVTARFADHLARRVGQGEAVARVAAQEGTSFYRAQASFTCYQRRKHKGRRIGAARYLSVDEASRLKGQKYNTVISDPEAPRVIDVVEGRKTKGLARRLQRLPEKVKAQVKAVVIDLWEPYRKAIGEALPKAAAVADKFHVIRQVTSCVDAVRRHIQNQVAPGRKAILFRQRHRLLKGRSKLTLKDLDELVPELSRFPQLMGAWELLWSLRVMYASSSKHEAEMRLDAWITAASSSEFVQFRKAAATFALWRQEILAYFDHPITNAYAEGITNKIKVMKRRAYGIPNFRNFRDRILADCG